MPCFSSIAARAVSGALICVAPLQYAQAQSSAQWAEVVLPGAFLNGPSFRSGFAPCQPLLGERVVIVDEAVGNPIAIPMFKLVIQEGRCEGRTVWSSIEAIKALR